MPVYEYKVIPAPTRGRKAPGVKSPEARFALGLEDMLNEMGQAGWEYQRTDILPSEERQGLTSSRTVYRSVLVFRRATAPETPMRDPAQTAATADTSENRQDPADEVPENHKT
ncbi:hypothetical protein [Roseovarius sp.]|uniref:hypothetical protein n=1 Tax=Roseovarius sp. TaxID=1486281 RepID=UPI00342E3859